jgi:hypothetical protein
MIDCQCDGTDDGYYVCGNHVHDDGMEFYAGYLNGSDLELQRIEEELDRVYQEKPWKSFGFGLDLLAT